MSELEIIEVGMEIEGRPCHSILTRSPTGAEIWLYIDHESMELVGAERIDGEWTDIGLDDARESYADLLDTAIGILRARGG